MSKSCKLVLVLRQLETCFLSCSGWLPFLLGILYSKVILRRKLSWLLPGRASCFCPWGVRICFGAAPFPWRSPTGSNSFRRIAQLCTQQGKADYASEALDAYRMFSRVSALYFICPKPDHVYVKPHILTSSSELRPTNHVLFHIPKQRLPSRKRYAVFPIYNRRADHGTGFTRYSSGTRGDLPEQHAANADRRLLLCV